MSAKRTEEGPPHIQSVMNVLCGGSFIISRDLTVEWVGSVTKRWSGGRSPDAIRGKRCHSVIMNRKKPCVNCPVLRSYETGETEQLEVRVGRKGGSAEYHLLTATPLRKEDGDGMAGVIEVIRDVTAFRRTEEDLKQLNEFNREIIENAPVAIFTINKRGEFSSVNPALATLSGLGTTAAAKEKLLGFNWIKNPYTVKCGMANYIKDGLKGKPFQLWDFPFINYWGVPQYIYFKGVPIKGKDGEVEGLLCIIEETTEIVRTRAQLMQEAKMSMIGRLTTGIAHELNNPLATITANAELALESLEGKGDGTIDDRALEELRQGLRVIEEQAFRCTKTIKSLLDVTRKKALGKKSIDFNGLLGDILDHINFRKLPVRFILNVPSKLPPVKGDFDAMRQVFLNVVSNAVDAVEGRADAAIWIKAGKPSGGTLDVTVEDNGPGIPKGMKELIFEPFFTTKGIKKGTGLGLTLCYDFLQRMGGSIDARNRLTGEGAVFRISLPLYVR